MPNYNPSPATRFKKGESGNPAGRPKGSRNYKTLFREAYKHIAKDLKLGKDPDALLVEILKRGIKEALKGNYPFYKDIMDRLYGKSKQTIENDEKRLLILTDEEEI
jgi:hypothetical protein